MVTNLVALGGRADACGFVGRDAEIEFSAEDASRTDLDYLLKVYEAVVEAGASVRSSAVMGGGTAFRR